MSKSRLHLLILFIVYAVGVFFARRVDWRLALVIGANCFFVTYLILMLTDLGRLKGNRMKRVAEVATISPSIQFMIATLVGGTAILALFLIINAKTDTPTIWSLLALLSIPLGWATIHTMAAFHYAYLFWNPEAPGEPTGGLEFHGGTKEPSGWDFIYFSFVIGLAAQTADVAISDPVIRKFALMHSIIAYIFNTVLVAAAVNIAVAGV